MKRLLIIPILLAVFSMSIYAQYQNGSTCKRAIPASNGLQHQLPQAGEYWFTAKTYDLPIKVRFVPDIDNLATPPVCFVDFTCDGNYDDAHLDSMINMAEGFGMEVPLKMTSSLVKEQGKNIYEFNIGSKYRDMMAGFGVTYDVQAYVRMEVKCAGEIFINPSSETRNCLDNAHMAELGDTLAIAKNDWESTTMLPFRLWEKDSIRLVWRGISEPVTLYLASQCNYDINTQKSFLLDTIVIEASDERKFLPNDLIDYTEEKKNNGIYYARIVSNEASKLIIERVPQKEAEAGAKQLRYKKAATLAENDSSVFYFLKSWKATRFETPTHHIMRMYIGTNSQIDTTDASTYIAKFHFDRAQDGSHFLELSDKEMELLSAKAKDDYLYVRFGCTVGTRVTPAKWENNDCATQTSILIRDNEPVAIAKGDKGALYRMWFPYWKGYDMTLKWTSNTVATSIPVAIQQDCSAISSGNGKNIEYLKKSGKNWTQTFTAADLNNWNNYNLIIDKDSFIYVRINSGAAGTLTITSTRPRETDLDTPDPVNPDPQPEIEYNLPPIWVQCTEEDGIKQYIVSVSYPQTIFVREVDPQTLTSDIIKPVDNWTASTTRSHTLLNIKSGKTYRLDGQSKDNEHGNSTLILIAE